MNLHKKVNKSITNKFIDDLLFIRDVIKNISEGTDAQKSEYKSKILGRYSHFIFRVIERRINSNSLLRENAFKDFLCQLYNPEYLKKYHGRNSFEAYIYPEIKRSVRNVMPTHKDLTFIQEIIRYMREGTEAQKTEYKDKLLMRYGSYIRNIIESRKYLDFSLKEDAFNDFLCKLYKPGYLEKYEGKASFESYINRAIIGSVRSVVTSGKGIVDEELYDDINITEDDNINFFKNRQYSQEKLLELKELRLILDQSVALSLLELSQLNAQDARILIMRQCNLSWDEIGKYTDIEINSVQKRYSRPGGIEDKFINLLSKRLRETYKIDISSITENINDMFDVD